MRKSLVFFSLIAIFISCTPTVDLTQVDFDGIPTVIYKVSDDYVHLVPVVLNEEKTKVVAYPAPKDMYNPKGELRFPTPLDKGFYLDQIGVGLNSAYTSLTIEEYAKMDTPPNLDSLYRLVIEKDPFKRMYNLGNRKQYLDEELVKEIVSSGKYKAYERLK
jgi:hypothetical protein